MIAGARAFCPPTSEAMLKAFALKNGFSNVRCATLRFAGVGGQDARAPTVCALNFLKL